MAELMQKAARCRRLATDMTDREMVRTLIALAESFEAQAAAAARAEIDREPSERAK